jgi:hypothetical protein
VFKMGWIDEISTQIPDSFLTKLFERVFKQRFTEKIKFTEIVGGYSFFDISIPVSPRYSITERIQMKAFTVKDLSYADYDFSQIEGEAGISTQGEIFYRFTEESKGAITCLLFKRYL